MNSLPTLVKLVLAHNFKNWGRALLGILGIALSACLVIWVIRSYDAVVNGQPKPDAKQLKADRFDVVVAPPMQMNFPGGRRGEGPRRPSPGGEAPRYVDAGLIGELRKDPAVVEVVASARMRVRVVSPEPVRQMGPFGGGMMMGTADGEPPKALDKGRWLEAGKTDEAVVSADFAGNYGLEVGSDLVVGGSGGEAPLKVVGVLAPSPRGGMMGMFSPNSAQIYLAVATADRINGFSDRFNSVCLVLKDSDVAGDFVDLWTAKTRANDPPVTFRSLRQKGGEAMDGRTAGMVQAQAVNGTILAFMAACFIIFATLSGGVRERLRELASLRAIALSRSQLAFMIFFEAVALALIGWAAGLLIAKLGVSLGNGLALWLNLFRDDSLKSYPLGWTSVWTSGACALVGSLAAATLPVWQATRIKPIDILGGSGEIVVRKFRWGLCLIGAALAVLSGKLMAAGPAQSIGGWMGACAEVALAVAACLGAAFVILSLMRRFPGLMSVVGLLLVLANPVAVLLAGDIERLHRIFGETFKMGFAPPILGCVAMIVGLAMLTPGFVRMIEAVFGPAMAFILRLDRRFLRQQLSGNLWRTVGTTISLSAGLALFVTVLVWGYSMLVPFTPDKSLPRILVSVLPAGVPEDAVGEVRAVDGVVPGEFLAMAVEQPRVAQASLDSKAFASVDPSQEHLLMMGVDPEKAFGGARPVLGFTFVQGDREDAVRKLQDAGHRYCLVPDHFQTQTGLKVGDKFGLEVPNAPGQTVEYEIAGVVSVPGWNWFTKFADIRRRAGRALAMVFADYDRVKQDFKLDRISYFWMNVDEKVSGDDMQNRLEPLADKYAGVRVDVPGVGATMVSKQYVKTTVREDIIERVTARAEGVFRDLKILPLGALIIASLALFNTIFASVRARFWQFGVLRGVGLSRWQLFRLVISESLMIFLAAGILSLGSGLLLGWTGTRICTFFFYFAGRTPPLTVPWGQLSLGFGIAFGLSLLAGLIPACVAAAKEPLKFIQAGRLSV